MRVLATAVLLVLAASCGSSGAGPDANVDASAQGDADASADAASDAGDPGWAIDLDEARSAGPIPTALLGQYDLSGALFRYAQVPGLIDAMRGAGFAEWRVGVGRWEISTLLLPTLTDGSSCATDSLYAALPPESRAPALATDDSLIAARDWFTDDGKPVTEAMTLDDARYSLTYVRSVVDAAIAFGTRPYVNVDLMPRALAKNRAPSRSKTVIPDACLATFTNAVCNVRPTDNLVFASAVAGLVQRVTQGSGGEKGRAVTHWEIWNEPEFPYFWDKAFETKGLDDWTAMMATTLVRLDAMRAAATAPEMKALRFGMGSFARAETAEAILVAFDGTPLPGGKKLPFDFLSFHSYHNDPLAIVADIERVAAARRTSASYKSIELALAEWGPQLDGMGWDPKTMDAPLLVSTVLALGAAQGLEHAHRALFYDFYEGLPFGLLDHGVRPKPLYHAYALLASLVGKGWARLPPKGHEDGKLDGGLGAVIASRDDAGVVRALLVNRGASARTATISVQGIAKVPSAVRVFDAPSSPPHEGEHARAVLVPPRSIVLVTL